MRSRGGACEHAIMINTVVLPAVVPALHDLRFGLSISRQMLLEPKSLQHVVDEEHFESAGLDGASKGQEGLSNSARASALSCFLFAADSVYVEAACSPGAVNCMIRSQVTA